MGTEKVLCVIFLSLSALAIPPIGLKEVEKMNENFPKVIMSGSPLVIGEVHDLDHKQQSLKYFVSIKHPKECSFALRRLSRYELFSKYISFVKESSYSDETKRINLLLDHTLMPFPIKLDFKLERASKIGVYHFEFDRGFMKGLQGEIHIASLENKSKEECLISGKADWVGEDTGINKTVFQVFVTTLSKIAMERLLKISSY